MLESGKHNPFGQSIGLQTESLWQSIGLQIEGLWSVQMQQGNSLPVIRGWVKRVFYQVEQAAIEWALKLKIPNVTWGRFH